MSTKKDYEMVAEAIASVAHNMESSGSWTSKQLDGAHVALLSVTRRIADGFQSDNSRFDRDRFFEATTMDRFEN